MIIIEDELNSIKLTDREKILRNKIVRAYFTKEGKYKGINLRSILLPCTDYIFNIADADEREFVFRTLGIFEY